MKFDITQILCKKFFVNRRENICVPLTMRQPILPDSSVARILVQQGSYKLAYGANSGLLYLSDDCGSTWSYSYAFANASNIRMAWVFQNGNILISTKVDNKMYLSTDKLTTLNEITVYESDGVTPITFHVPVNPLYPGIYFGALNPRSYTVDGSEVLAWGTYWQGQDGIGAGAVPINIYYTSDNGITVKCCYKFGDNATERDDGTAISGAGGNVVGDPTNPVICHHVHTTAYDSINNYFYFVTGDSWTNSEINYLRGRYDLATDTWNFHNTPMNSNFGVFKTGQLIFDDEDHFIWTCDDDLQGGIYRCAVADILASDITKHEKLYFSIRNPRGDMLAITKFNKYIFAARYNSLPAIVASCDFGQTWNLVSDSVFDVGFPGHFQNTRKFFEKDDNGYYLVNSSSLAGQCVSYSWLFKVLYE